MRLGRYAISVKFEDDALLPGYLGSTLRGAFGAALKTSMCGNLARDCGQCRIAERCLYAKTFEPKVTADNPSTRGIEPPSPYVVEPPEGRITRIGKGETLAFTLLLFGEANSYLPFFLNAFEVMGRRGIGRRSDGPGGALFALSGVEQDQGENLYDSQTGRLMREPVESRLELSHPTSNALGTLNLEMQTPLRLKFQSHLQDTLPFHVLVRSALRRVSSVLEAHGEGTPEIEYGRLVAEAGTVPILSSRLRWLDWERYSNRQKRHMLLGGIVGTISYGNVPGEYLPILEAARVLHLGKQSTFGLGRLTLEWNPLT